MPRIVNPMNPYSELGRSIASLGQAFMSGPNPLEREQMAAQLDAARVTARKGGLEADKLAAEATARKALAGRFAQPGLDVDGASSDAVLAGYDPQDLAALHLFRTANGGGTDEATTAALLGTGKTLGVNDAVSIGHQTDVRNANASLDRRTKLDVQALGDLNALARQNALPVQTTAGSITTFAPGDPRGGSDGVVRGMPTEATAKGAIVDQIGAGTPVNPMAQRIVGSMTGMTDVAKLIAERDALPPDSPDRAVYDAAIAKETTSSQGIVVNGPDGKPMVQIGGSPQKLTEAQATAAARADMMAVGDTQLDALESKGYVPTMASSALITAMRQPPTGFVSSITQTLANTAMGDDDRMFATAAQQFVDSFGRALSGAAITSGEWQSFYMQTLPMAGDDPATIKQKGLARNVAIDAQQRAAAGGATPDQQWVAIQQAILSGQMPGEMPQATQGGPAIGTIEDGYRFMGGDPADPRSWQPAGSTGAIP